MGKRKKTGLKDDVLTKVEKVMLRWFGHAEWMNERKTADMS